jgi:putative transcriptional regulator
MRQPRWIVWGAWFIWGFLVGVVLLLAGYATSARAADTAIMLVASPSVGDPHYRQAVVIAASMPAGGHVGLIANRPSRTRLADLFPDFPPARAVTETVRYGGPMNVTALGMVVRTAELKQGTFALMPGAFLVLTAPEIDRQIETAPNDARYFVGLIVWAPGELANEIGRGIWHQVPAPANALWVKDTTRMWRDHAPKGPSVDRGTGGHG